MSKRALVCVGAMVTVLGPASATAAPDTIEPFPITDPSWEPEYWGLGQEPDVQGAFNTPTILFVNFDGGKMNGGCGNDSHNDCSTITNGEILPFPGDDSARAAVMQAVRADVEDFGVIAVGERPPDSQPYAMVMVGEPAGGGMGSVGGVAPGIDCGNSNPNITSFCFLTGGSNIVATVVHQEAAHTWGLEHVDDEFDNLYPTAGGATDPKYNDQCSKIVSDTDLNPTSGQCNQVHTMFCDSGYQNSYQEMLALFGPPVADTTAPTVTIDSPTDGQVLDYSESFDLIITLDDDRRPQVLDTIISFDDAEVLTQKFVNKTLTFPITGGDPPSGHGLGNGEHTIVVEITDESGNPAMAEVTIVIENAPAGAGDETGGASGTGGSGGGVDGTGGGTGGGDGSAGDAGMNADDEGCACNVRPPSPAGWALLLVALGIVRRRTEG